MANEIRLRANNISGAINDNPLLIGATTINSPQFAELPVVDSTNHLILTLDPLEVYGQAEVVRVTTHTAAATSVTVTRGVDGTTARQHPLTTNWFHGPVVSDWNFTDVLALSTNRPATPFSGQMIYETDTNRYTGRSSAAAWQQMGLFFDPPAVRVTKSANQSIGDAGAGAAVTWDVETFDTNGMHDNVTNNQRITFITPGIYIVQWSLVLDVGSDYRNVFSFAQLNATTNIGVGSQVGTHNDAGSSGLLLTGSIVYKFAANDFIHIQVVQDNAGNVAKNLLSPRQDTNLSACWIGRGN